VAFINIKFNIISTIFILKLEALLFAVFSAILIKKIIVHITGKTRESTYAAIVFLLSPFLFFINFVIMEMDIYAIFFTLLAIYFYIKSYPNDNLIFNFIVFGILVYASLMYYFPLIVILILLVYSKKLKELWFKLFSITTWGIAFLRIYHFFNIWSFINPNSSISPSSNSVFSVYYIFNFQNANMNLFYYAMALLFIVVLSILLKKRDINQYATITISFIIVMSIIQIYNADEFIWILPFLILSLASSDIKKHVDLKIFLSQFYMLPPVLILNIWEGRFGMGTGIFYFGYYFLHRATLINDSIPDPVFFTKILGILFYVILIFILVSFIIIIPRKNKIDRHKIKPEKIHERKIMDRPKNNKKIKVLKAMRHSRLISIVLLIFVASLLIIVPLNTNIEAYNPDFPFGIFIPIPVADNATFNYGFTSNGHNITISPTTAECDRPLILQRNVTGEILNLNMSISSSTGSKLLDCNQLLDMSNLSVSDYTYIPLNNSDILNPYIEQNTSSATNYRSFMWGFSNLSTYRAYGNSTFGYAINTSHQANLVFFFKPVKLEFKQNIVFRLQNGNSTYSLTQYSPRSFSFSYSPSFGIWEPSINIYTNNLYNWYGIELEINKSNISLSLNGKNWIEYPFKNLNSSLLYLGIFQPANFANFNYSYDGYFSDVYGYENQPALNVGYQISNNTNFFTVLNSTVRSVMIKTLVNNTASINFNNHILYSPVFNSILYFGRLNFSIFSINIEINNINIKNSYDTETLSINLILTYIVPAELILLYSYCYVNKKKKYI
jgi:hypothetical protein